MHGTESGIYLGIDHQARPVHLDMSKATNFSIALCGMSGSGKSYSIRKLVAGFARMGVTQYILDVHGDLGEFEGVPPEGVNTIHFDYGGGARINPLKVLPGEPLNASVSEFIDGTMKLYAKNLGQQQIPLLREMVYDTYALKGIQRDDEAPWAKEQPQLSDLIMVCKFYIDQDSDPDRKMLIEESIPSWLQKAESSVFLDARAKSKAMAILAILSGMEHTDLFGEDTVLIKPGRINRLDISTLSDPDKVAVINLTLGRVNAIATRRAKVLNPMLPAHVIVMDEAKIFNQASRSSILDEIATQGRKYGIGIVLGAQSPDHLTPDQIRSCATTLILSQHPRDKGSASRKFGIPIENVSSIKPRSDALLYRNEGAFLAVQLFRSALA